jgi:hypothetical protein
MTKTILFIDYENIQNIELSTLQDNPFEIKIFVRQNQNKIAIELVQATQPFGKAVEWLKIEGDGKNALDFHIAFYLGCLSQTETQTSFIILSKDTGYDPLIRHAKKLGIKCRRINSILELSKTNQLLGLNTEQMTKVIENLSKNVKNRPRTRKTLHTHINAMFQNKLNEAEVNKIIDSLFFQKKLIEDNNKLTYNF